MSGAGVRLRKDLQLRIHGAFPSAPRFLIFCVSRHSPTNSATDAAQRVLAECWVQTLHVRNEFSLRSPEWWRDLTLGLLLGGSLIWALSDTTFHWETVKTHAFAEVVCVAILLALALLSPRPLPLRFTFIKTFQAARRFDRYHAGSLRKEGR